jgi:hypothetical protein
MNFTILPDGSVDNVKIVDSMIENEKMLIDVMSAMYKMKYAKGGEGSTIITYPIELQN